MNFNELERRLVSRLRDRVQRGEITERGLARVTGVSQPHMHNVLKGTRFLSQETADEILRNLRLDVLDLIGPGEMLEWTSRLDDSTSGFAGTADAQYPGEE